ncbi:MAG TPA: ABC transporter permease [Thermomicrobiales bacterium]|nr:ABC transporter permease [Thermomicrobiales bacterium]
MSQPTAPPAERPASAAAASGARRVWNRVSEFDEIGVVGAFLAISLALSLTSDKFLRAENLLSVARQSSYIGIMAVGMVFVISMGDIDLSVGAMLMLVTVSMAVLFQAGQATWIVIVAGLLIGALCGFVNGVLSVLLRIPTIIVTLGTLSVFRGLGLVVSGGAPVSGYDQDTWFFRVVGGKFLDIWMSVWAMLLVAVVGWVLFTRTAFGRRVQAIGSNRQAARFSGIRISYYRVLVMTLMGLIVGVAAVVLIAFQRAGNPSSGPGQELYVIAATIIGGTALTGGSGSVPGAIIGALIVWLIQNGLTLLAVSPNWAVAATGLVIIAAVALDYLIKRRPASG